MGNGFHSRHRKRRFSQRAGGGYQPIQMAFWPPVLPEPTSVRTLIERTRKMAESTSLGIFTERTKKLIEPTSFRVFTERTRKLAEPTRLRILTERTKQRLWILLIENPRNNLFLAPIENVEEWLQPRIQLRIHNGHITMAVD